MERDHVLCFSLPHLLYIIEYCKLYKASCACKKSLQEKLKSYLNFLPKVKAEEQDKFVADFQVKVGEHEKQLEKYAKRANEIRQQMTK